MKAAVIYESLTGNTAKAGHLIAAKLTEAGFFATASPVDQVDLETLSGADLVVVGSWVDGMFFFGQKPGRSWRLDKIPVIDGMTTAVYCTYAIDAGKTLSKLQKVVEKRGGNVIGGYAIKRSKLEQDTTEFVERLLGALSKESPEELQK